MFCPELLHAKDVSNLGASFGAYSGQVLSGTSVECVPEGRALSCSLKSVLSMDAFRGGGIPLAVPEKPGKHSSTASGRAPV